MFIQQTHPSWLAVQFIHLTPLSPVKYATRKIHNSGMYGLGVHKFSRCFPKESDLQVVLFSPRDKNTISRRLIDDMDGTRYYNSGHENCWIKLCYQVKLCYDRIIYYPIISSTKNPTSKACVLMPAHEASSNVLSCSFILMS